MKQTIELDQAEQVVDVPVSAVLSVERSNRYGSVPGLTNEELADPDELERQVYAEMFRPVLQLPVQGRHSSIQPNIDEGGKVDWGAFGTVDFERMQPEFDKVRYKAEKLREQVKDLLIRLSIVKERVPGRAKYQVLKYLKMGVIRLEHIVSHDMLAMVRLYLRVKRLQQEIARLEQASWVRKQRQVEAWVT